MDSYLFNGCLSEQNTDKTSNKVHFEKRGPAETVVLWLECTFKHTCVFFQAAIKVEKNHPYKCGFMLFF